MSTLSSYVCAGVSDHEWYLPPRLVKRFTAVTLKNQFRQRYYAVMVFQRSGLAYVLPDSE